MHGRQINVPLSKILALRVRCRNKGCGVVVEMHIDELRQKFRNGKCPFCQAQLVNPANSPFEILGQAVMSLAAHFKQMEIAFVIPDDDEPSTSGRNALAERAVAERPVAKTPPPPAV